MTRRVPTSPDASEAPIFQTAVDRTPELIPADQFDAAGYLRLNPDVRNAVDQGHFESAYAHYLAYGSVEGRSVPESPRETRNVMLTITAAATAMATPVSQRCAIDALIVAPSAGLMIVGWIDDLAHPLNCIRVIAPTWRVVLDRSRLIRLRRTDVEQALGGHAQHSYGFFGVLHFERGGEVDGPILVELWQEGGGAAALQCTPRLIDAAELRNTALSHLAASKFFGNPAIESLEFLGKGVGKELIELNRVITSRATANPYVERFGTRARSPLGTIIVCLYGKAEFYFVQNCLFSALPGIEDYEFIYVSNSPEIAEILLREAQSASLIYGMANSVAILSGNAGFGAANNAAAQLAHSNRLLIVNPDVFPRDRDWAAKHTTVLQSVPSERTRLFGAPLYYDDGSLMHGGMHFESDVGFGSTGGVPVPRRIYRVEHYGKGAPPETEQFTRARPVPAVSGAFMSVERNWFETLGGFSEEYIFGHYEDADLCLKSISRGIAPWIHDIRLWHLEGKGSHRLPPHEGGSMVNRWLFSETWESVIEAGLKGSAPGHPLLQPPQDHPSPLLARRSRALR